MDLSTRISLIQRLKQAPAQRDWEQFYSKYHAVILSFARKQGLDEHSAFDALQETMMVVMRKLPAFEYDAGRGRFRNWLMTIVANKVREARRRSHMDKLLSMDAPQGDGTDDLHEHLAAEEPDASVQLEEAWRQSLVEEALRRVLGDPRTKPETVEVFRACALDNEPVAQVAARFGLKENAVYQIKNRLMARLKDIINAMETGEAEPPPDAEA